MSPHRSSTFFAGTAAGRAGDEDETFRKGVPVKAASSSLLCWTRRLHRSVCRYALRAELVPEAEMQNNKCRRFRKVLGAFDIQLLFSRVSGTTDAKFALVCRVVCASSLALLLGEQEMRMKA